MNPKFLYIIICFPLIIVNPTFSQSEIKIKEKKKNNSLSFHYGRGNYTIKDAYISQNLYKANGFDYFKVGWNSDHQRYNYFLTYAFANGKAENGIVTANIQEYWLNQGFLYNTRPQNTIGKFNFLIGPITDFFVHYRSQNIASSRLTQSYSVALLFSAAIAARIEYTPFKKLSFTNDLKLNIISIAARLPDYTLEDYKIVRVQTPFSTMLLQNNFEISYRILKNIDIQLAYMFQLMNFSEAFSQTSWDELGWSEALSISNYLTTGIKIWI